MHTVELILPCQPESGQTGCSVGHCVFKHDDWFKCTDYADQHFMLTGQRYVAVRDGDFYSHVHTGQMNTAFLEG
jgi:hypothetical protein